MNAIRAGGSARGSNGLRKERDEKEETGSVVSSTFSLGEPVGEEATKEEPLPVEKADSHDISGESTPTAIETPAQSDDDQRVLSLKACLFCPYVSPSLTLNVAHMTKAHGLFIPEASFLVDLPGLITYLGQKLVLGNQCLYCNKTKGGLEGIRTHMQDKGHTMLGFETEEQQVELGQFYDFRSTYSDAGEESESSDEADAGRKLKPKAPEDDEGWEAEGGEGEGWETDSDTSIDSTELGTIPVDPEYGHGREGGRRHHMQDGWHSHAHGHIYHDEYELHLPSGRSVGHRSLARYYKQNLREHPLQDKAVRRLVDTRYPHNVEYDEDDDDTDDGGVEVEEFEERALNRWERRGEARALARRGEAGMIGVSVAKRHEVAKLEKRGQIEEQRGRRRYEWGVNKVGNNQKHFRDPLLQ
jgi:pre-60S factor REI1